MENIESTIVELGVIFKQLAEMVKDQEEQVERYVTSSTVTWGSWFYFNDRSLFYLQKFLQFAGFYASW